MEGSLYFLPRFGREGETQRGELAPSGTPDQTWTPGNLASGTLADAQGTGIALISSLSAWTIGTPMMKTADPEICVPATNECTGFLTRHVVTGTGMGPLLKHLLDAGYYNVPQPYGQGMKATLVNLKVGEVVEVEGEPSKTSSAATNGLLVTSGTGDMTNAAITNKVSFYNGRYRIAQTGDIPYFKVRGTGLTPQADSSNLRVELEYIGKDAPAL